MSIRAVQPHVLRANDIHSLLTRSLAHAFNEHAEQHRHRCRALEVDRARVQRRHGWGGVQEHHSADRHGGLRGTDRGQRVLRHACAILAVHDNALGDLGPCPLRSVDR